MQQRLWLRTLLVDGDDAVSRGVVAHGHNRRRMQLEALQRLFAAAARVVDVDCRRVALSDRQLRARVAFLQPQPPDLKIG